MMMLEESLAASESTTNRKTTDFPAGPAAATKRKAKK